MDYTPLLNQIISELSALQSSLTSFSGLFSGGFFWFALFCVGVVLILGGYFLYIIVKFFLRLLWGQS
jgi:predicted phage tail protein